MTKISIITINYNDATGLEKTILSVINQTNADIEYIVIDGNSTDESKTIIKNYQNNINYWVSEEDLGIYNAMNKGIHASNGEYLLFMNSGDVLINDPTILSICSEKLKEDIVAFDCFLEENNNIVGRRTHIEFPTFFYVYRNGFKHQSTFIKKKLFEKLGLYNEKYKIAGDYEFWIRSFLDPKTIVKSYANPIAIFQLGGISQNSDWGVEHGQIEKELLPHLIADFQMMNQLLPYQNSRILKLVIKWQKWFNKIKP